MPARLDRRGVVVEEDTQATRRGHANDPAAEPRDHGSHSGSSTDAAPFDRESPYDEPTRLVRRPGRGSSADDETTIVHRPGRGRQASAEPEAANTGHVGDATNRPTKTAPHQVTTTNRRGWSVAAGGSPQSTTRKPSSGRRARRIPTAVRRTKPTIRSPAGWWSSTGRAKADPWNWGRAATRSGADRPPTSSSISATVKCPGTRTRSSPTTTRRDCGTSSKGAAGTSFD